MFEILNQSTDKCLVAHMSGKITGQEYQLFLNALEEYFKKVNEVDLVMDLKGLEFYGDLEALKKDVKFGFGEYKKLRKVALVGEQKWIEIFTKIWGTFTPTVEKYFPENEFQKALDWIKT